MLTHILNAGYYRVRADTRILGTNPGILTHNEEEEEKHVDHSNDDGVQHGGHHERQGAHHDPILGADAVHPKA